MRRTAGLATITALVVLLAACGSPQATPSPSVEPSPTAAAPTEAAPSASQAAASQPAASPSASGAKTMKAACAGVRVRATPAPKGKLVVVLAKGTKVRAVGTVTGDAYTAGSCGTSGDAWVKIDRVNGKSVKKLYDVDFGYVAAGFLK